MSFPRAYVPQTFPRPLVVKSKSTAAPQRSREQTRSPQVQVHNTPTTAARSSSVVVGSSQGLSPVITAPIAHTQNSATTPTRINGTGSSRIDDTVQKSGTKRPVQEIDEPRKKAKTTSGAIASSQVSSPATKAPVAHTKSPTATPTQINSTANSKVDDTIQRSGTKRPAQEIEEPRKKAKKPSRINWSDDDMPAEDWEVTLHREKSRFLREGELRRKSIASDNSVVVATAAENKTAVSSQGMKGASPQKTEKARAPLEDEQASSPPGASEVKPALNTKLPYPSNTARTLHSRPPPSIAPIGSRKHNGIFKTSLAKSSADATHRDSSNTPVPSIERPTREPTPDRPFSPRDFGVGRQSGLSTVSKATTSSRRDKPAMAAETGGENKSKSPPRRRMMMPPLPDQDTVFGRFARGYSRLAAVGDSAQTRAGDEAGESRYIDVLGWKL